MRLSLRQASSAAALTMLVLLVVNVLLRDWDFVANVIDDLAILFINVLAVVILFHVSRLSALQGRRAMLGWTLLALSMISCVAAGIGIALGDLFLHTSALQPYGTVDAVISVSFLIFYPLSMAGFYLLPYKPLGRSEKIKIALDTGMVAISAFLFFWIFLIAPGADPSSDVSLLAMTTSTIIPVLDVVFVFTILVLLIRRLTHPVPTAFFLIAAIFSAIECVFSLRWAQGIVYPPFHPMQLTLVAGYLMVILGGISQIEILSENDPSGLFLRHHGMREEDGDCEGFDGRGDDGKGHVRRCLTFTWPFYLPYLCAAAAYLLIVFDGYRRLPISHTVLTLGVGGIIGLVIIRQIVALEENGTLCIRTLSEVKERRRAESEVRRLNDALEEKVEERTRELALANEDLCREIKRRSEYEILLEESERSYKELVNNAIDLIFTLDLQGNFASINDAAEAITGYSREDLLGRNISGFLDREAGSTRDRIIQNMVSDAPQNDCVLRFRRKDGAGIMLDVKSQRRCRSGRHMEIFGVARDVTYRKHAEEALRKSEAQLRAVFAAARSISFIMTDACSADPGIIEFSPGAEASFGYRREEIVGKPLSILRMPGDVASYPAYYRALKACPGDGRTTDVGISGVYSMVRRSGESFPALLSMYPLLDGSGEMYAVLVVSIDITEQKVAEESLKSTLEEKEVMLREIHNRVKNNLQVIYSLLSVHLHNVHDEPVSGLLRVCQNRVRSMALIHESLYRSENLASVDFARYIRRLVSFLFISFGASSRKIAVIYELGEVRLTIEKAIPCGLMVNEIVSNSIKHAFPDEMMGRILIRLRHMEDGRVILVISDDGIGMQESADPGSKSVGLALLKALAKQLNATVDLDITAGTEFRIAFAA